jgi:uracil-DNA glycosylase
VPSFGAPAARLLVVGLAPGLRGANRTGRPFTGDFAGAILYPALLRHGFARGRYAAAVDDGFELVDCRIANAVRCVPPANRPTPAEIATCRRFLVGELGADPAPRAVLTLGRIAHESALRALGLTLRRFPFAHGAWHDLPDGRVLAASYHTSRYNVNTGVLTESMFDAVVARLAAALAAGAPPSPALSA